jgi:hypothetical protein
MKQRRHGVNTSTNGTTVAQDNPRTPFWGAAEARAATTTKRGKTPRFRP